MRQQQMMKTVIQASLLLFTPLAYNRHLSSPWMVALPLNLPRRGLLSEDMYGNKQGFVSRGGVLLRFYYEARLKTSVFPIQNRHDGNPSSPD